ncbi:unnamed protein product [Adineta steineri]|uniref:Uncharacterized protein n=1 Tax=Adineta steineri TaxID=433720 RepID=A0A815S152_9BILA|nr:unnamed protein product [Adineta steineri]CAF1639231.1 unnamed protein product [Adineta steineri]
MFAVQIGRPRRVAKGDTHMWMQKRITNEPNSDSIQSIDHETYGQVGSAKDTDASGEVHLWMRLNGEDMADSNTIQTVDADTTVSVCQAVIKMEAGDKLELMFSTDVTKGKLSFVISQPEGEETIPRMSMGVSTIY